MSWSYKLGRDVLDFNLGFYVGISRQYRTGFNGSFLGDPEPIWDKLERMGISSKEIPVSMERGIEFGVLSGLPLYLLGLMVYHIIQFGRGITGKEPLQKEQW